jgi:hypothetical protein
MNLSLPMLVAIFGLAKRLPVKPQCVLKSTDTQSSAPVPKGEPGTDLLTRPIKDWQDTPESGPDGRATGVL